MPKLFDNVTSIKKLFGKPVNVFRCEADGAIVLETQESMASHGGHYLKQPVRLSIIERAFIHLRIIR